MPRRVSPEERERRREIELIHRRDRDARKIKRLVPQCKCGKPLDWKVLAAGHNSCTACRARAEHDKVFRSLNHWMHLK